MCRCICEAVKEARFLGENDTRPEGMRIEDLLKDYSLEEIEEETDDEEFLANVRIVISLSKYDRSMPEDNS